jgi:Phage capsid protein
MSSPQLSIFKREWITAFQMDNSLLRSTVNTTAMVEGGEAVWTVSSPGSGRMQQRGVDGRIPSSNGIDNQIRSTLREAVHKEIKTGFDIFTAGPSQRKAVIDRGKAKVEREFDQEILDTTLSTTNNIGATGTIGTTAVGVTYNGITNIAATVLNNVKNTKTGGLTWLWTPKAWAKLHQFAEFTNSQLVGDAKLDGQNIEMRKWIFGTHMLFPDLPGAASNSAACFVYHKDAVGHAYDSKAPRIEADFDKEDQYDFMSAVVMHTSKILQTGGVWRIYHDDTV